MAPWEQHSAVISIPRFDYKASSSLLDHSHSGFLVTCPIKREKSATKEAMFILEKCFEFCTGGSPESSENFDDIKRRKICFEETDEKSLISVEHRSEITILGDVGKRSEGSDVSSQKPDTNVEGMHGISLVKVTKSGLLLFIFPRNKSLDVVDILSNIFHFLKSGTLRSPLWCHRFFPVQATCCLNEKELRAVVSKLVIQFVSDRKNELGRPVKFAVGYNRRGTEETELKIPRDTSGDCDAFPLLDRNKCFALVASAVKDVVSDSVVDLKSPELSVLIELLPLSAVPNTSIVVGVSVLPHNLVSTKPRLCVKALVSDAKARNGRKSR